MLLVMPHATRLLRPIITPGTPASATPATLNEPPWRHTSCQIDTAPNGTCGSLATIGCPDTVREPASTQLLLPPQPSPPPEDSGRLRSRLAGYSPAYRMLSPSSSPRRKSR